MVEQVLLTKEDLAELKAMVEEMRQYLMFLTKVFCFPTTVNITGISKLLGVSRTQLKTKEAYLVPYFGLRGDFPDGTKRWKWETWSDWNVRPVEERKAEYLAYLDSARKKNKKKGGVL